MTEEELKVIAQLLRKPEGEYAKQMGERMNQGNEIINLRVLQALNIKSNDHVLEVGMGNGYFVQHLFQEFPEITYTGCDYSEEMVRAAIQLNQHLKKQRKIEFKQTEAHNLPVLDSSIDTLFTVNTIYFYHDLKVVLKEYRRVLKKGGELVIGIRPKHQMKEYPMTKYGFELFSKDDLVRHLEAANFNLDRIFEKEEPKQEFEGIKIDVSSLIVVAKK